MKTIIAVMLLSFSGVTHALDQIDVYDHSAGYRLTYTGCVTNPYSETLIAECQDLSIQFDGNGPPGNVTAFSSFPVTIHRAGSFYAVWDQCYLTEAYGLPKGGVYFRLDCLDQGG